jgi:hypothetical protein
VGWADWIGISNEDAAKNWARSWPEIQGYIHAYRAVTGVDLTNPHGVDHMPRAIHLRKPRQRPYRSLYSIGVDRDDLRI